ncbi:hypothetical protein EJB05_02049, partial [Eragrostis curvula]
MVTTERCEQVVVPFVSIVDNLIRKRHNLQKKRSLTLLLLPFQKLHRRKGGPGLDMPQTKKQRMHPSELQDLGARGLQELVCKDAMEISWDRAKRDYFKIGIFMEAAVVSGMLKIVSYKLAPLVIKEYNSIVGVRKDLQELQSQVEELNSWLETAVDNSVGSGPSLRWLEQLKDVVYDVDDIVDEFHLEAVKYATDGNGGKHIVSKFLSRKPKSLLLHCKAAHKIKAIKNRFAAIVRQRTNVSTIANSLPFGHPVRCITKRTCETTPSLPIVDASSVIGREQEKQQIISKLVEIKDQKKIKLVSIVGLGGSGKTMLANLVFNDFNIVEKHFEARLWVHVSQEFDIEKLIKKLFESIADKDPGQHALPYMSKRIKEELTAKRFLLVLDDVWTECRIQWETLMVYLKSGAPGSRILITARSRKVAEIVGSTDQFDLPFLSPDDSWQLFQQSLVIPANGLDLEFVEVGKEIVKKCGGVPLAIKALAGVLRGKDRIQEWMSMRDSNLLDIEGEEHSVSVSACLRLSYFHLPSHLKECFKLCSVFPKGHEIDKEQLIDQWIAHDMITMVDGVDYLEYTGHRYFDSLVQMSFLQNVDEYNGRLRCRMHDLVHDLARSIMGDEISLAVPMEYTSSSKSYRYFSLIEDSINLPSKNVLRKARAMFVAVGDFRLGKTLKNAKHLRSITVKPFHATSTPVITGVVQIKHLRYLCISILSFETIAEAVSEIWSLQALHVTNSPFLQKLPESIGKLQKLRTLNLSGCKGLLSIPDSIGNCHMISSIDLWGCVNLTVLPNSICNNNKLRVLRLGHTRIEMLPSRITTLDNLEYLDLRWCKCLVELLEGIENLQKLHVLNLEKCENLRAMPIGIGRLGRLQNLRIFVVGKDEKDARITELGNVARNSGNLTIRGIAHVVDPNDAHMACLKQKTNLQRLHLDWGKNDVDEMNTEKEQAVLDGLEPPLGIKELYIGRYAGWQYARWMLTQVSDPVQELRQFPFLTFMKLSNLPNLKHLDGLVELPCLEDLRLLEMPSLESINGGPFPSLVKLKLFGLPSLEELWMVAVSTLAVGDEGGGCSNPHQLGLLLIGTCLSHLEIERCPKLMVKPYLPLSLEKFTLFRSNDQLLQSTGLGQGSSLSSSFPPSFSFCHLKDLELWYMTVPSPPPGLGSGLHWELLQHMTALESLHIYKCDSMTELPESVQSLKSLRSLCIDGSSAVCMLPEWLGELRSLQKMNIKCCDSLGRLPQSMADLTCLQVLQIEWCDALDQLPECLGDLCLLRKFVIQHLRGLTCLPQSICRLTSLEKLVIHDCPGIKSLPEGIKGLPALQQVDIFETKQKAYACTCPRIATGPYTLAVLLWTLCVYKAFLLPCWYLNYKGTDYCCGFYEEMENHPYGRKFVAEATWNCFIIFMLTGMDKSTVESEGMIDNPIEPAVGDRNA